MARVLFVMTGVDHWTLADGSTHPTGFWAEEAIAPLRAFRAAGHEITVATPGGVAPTVDQASLGAEANGGQDAADDIERGLREFEQLWNPARLEDVRPSDYDAVFYPGGHGPMEDLSDNDDSARLLTTVLNSGTPLGIVCHAPAALLATGRHGTSPFAGYRITGFTNAEERQVGLADKAPWLLQDRLTDLGVRFHEGEPWTPNVVVDRTVYTGQNPASAAPLAAEIVRALR